MAESPVSYYVKPVFLMPEFPRYQKTTGAVRRAKEVMIKCVTVTKRMRGTMSESKEKCIFMTKRIGSTVFKVRVHLPEDGTETAEEKMLRIIQNEVMTADEICDTIEVPQTSRQSERSA